MGRSQRTKTPKEFTPEMLAKIDEMAYKQCLDATIAAQFGWQHETFKKEFGDRTHQKRCEGKNDLYRKQFDMAMSGNSTMLIWTGKQFLDQKDNPEFGTTVMAHKIVMFASPATKDTKDTKDTHGKK